MNAFTQAAPALFVGALLDASASMSAVHDGLSDPSDVQGELAKACKLLKKMHHVRAAARAWMQRLATADPEAAGADLDATAALLLAVERQGDAARRAFHQRIEQLRRSAGKTGRSARHLRQIASRADAAWLVLLTTARDLRWAVMAAQAMQAPLPDPESLALASPEDVTAWLAALPVEA